MFKRRSIGFAYQCLLASALLLGASMSYASAFQLWEENSGTLGDSHAGGAAQADTAADEFYNPAGIVRIKKTQVSVGGTFVGAHMKFDQGGQVIFNLPGGGTKPFSLETDALGSTNNVVPNFHVVVPLNDQWYFSFGVTTPFGLATDYTGTATTQYAATDTEVLSFNLNPSIAYAITSKLSFGVGFDALYGNAVYDSVVPALGPFGEAPFTNNLDGWGYGYNAGILYQLSEATRLGASYRSSITVDASGPSEYGATTTTATASLPMPATTILSMYHDISQKLAVMASATYSQWGVLQSIDLYNTAFIESDISDAKDFKDTWYFALGTDYKLNDVVTLMFGASYDQSPAQDGYRDVRLPDEDHTTLSIGAHIKPTKKLGVDVGYAHVFLPKADVDDTRSGAPVNETGTIEGGADMIALQLNYTF